MKTKAILIILLISTMILPIFIPTISFAYEELGKEEILTENDVEQEETKEEENLKQSGDKTKENAEEDIEEPEVLSEQDERIKEENDLEVPEKQNIVKSKTMRATVNTSNQLPEGDGIYTISTALDNSKVLDVDGGSKNNGANIQIWNNTNVEQQKFELKYNAQFNSYTMKAVHSNKVLDVDNAGKTNGTNVQQYEVNSSNAQQWTLQNAGNGYYYVISKCNGLYLDVSNGETKNGTNIQVYQGNGSNAQKFKFTKEPELITEQLREGDGIYTIATALNTNKVLDIGGGSYNDGANVQIWENSNVEQQKFELKYNAQLKIYTISAVHSNKVLDVDNAGKTSGTNVQQHTRNNTEAQQWVLQNAGNGYYYMISKCNGLYLDVSNGETKNGTNIQMYQGNGSNAQKFRFTKEPELITEQLREGDGIYTIATALNTNKVLDIAGGSYNENANVQIWNHTNAEQQKFELKYNSQLKTYTISAVHSDKVLDVDNAGKASGTNVQQHTSNNSKAQQWVLKEAGNGYYYIISKCNGLYLDVSNGEAKDGANIQVYQGNTSNAQKFRFIKTEKLESATLPEGDGIYTISTALNTNKVLDIGGGSYSNGANVQLWNDENVNQQKFKMIYDAQAKAYKIVVMHSNKVLDVANGGTTSGTNVQQYDSNNTISQRWALKDAGDGYYYMISKCNGLYLDVNNGKATDGTNIQVYTGNKSAAQRFKFTTTGVENGLYTIRSALNTNYVLDLDNASYENGANIQLYGNNGTNAQKWEVKYLGKGYYSILSAQSGKVMDVAGGGMTNGTNVQQYDSNGTTSQQWIFKDAGNGYFYIISKCNGLYLDVNNGVIKNGSNIQMYQGNGDASQKFKFEKTKKTNTSNFQNLNEKQYPGYKSMLQQLQNKHPNWSFEIYYTGLNWNTAVEQQDVMAGINSPRSLVHQSYYTNDSGGAQWINGFTKYDTSKKWYRASKKGIAYMMDPRNSLEEKWIFQFQDLTDSSATKEEILKMLSKTTFLKNKETAVDTIVKRCISKGVNPFHIVARMVQEQGENGSSTNGFKCDHGYVVYNLFNIMVSGDDGLRQGANYACSKGWNTQEKCIEGSIDFIQNDYIGVGQSTLYFQKYNVVNKIYSHQYMTNIYAANDEGNKMYQGYDNNNLLNREFKFVIPVYENMPSSPSPRPGR